MNVFYDHLINIHDLHIEFDRLDLPIPERNELMKLADSTVHHEVFDLIMIELADEHRSYFLEVFSTDPGDPELLQFITSHIPDAEGKIKSRADKVKEDLLAEVGKIK